MYLNFSNFRGRISAGGQALVQKRGQVSDGGGIGKIFAGCGDPQFPQEKNPDFIKNFLIKKNKNQFQINYGVHFLTQNCVAKMKMLQTVLPLLIEQIFTPLCLLSAVYR